MNTHILHMANPIQLGKMAFTLLLLFSFSISINAQRTCGTDEFLEYSLQNDAKFAAHYRHLKSMPKVSLRQESSSACASPVVIPVAVHFNTPITCEDKTCLLDAVEAQLVQLNLDFAASNADYQEYLNLNSACPSAYPLSTAPVQNEGTCVQFCLASMNHPDCSGLADGDPAITVGFFDWSTAPGWEGYLNIFVSNSVGGLGIAFLPGSANGDGFWVTHTAFGGPGFTCSSGGAINTSTNYGLGRTATHEAGHYLGLPHVFGGCGDSDSNPPGPLAIEDTPGQSDSYSGCPGAINDCGDVLTQCTDQPISFFSYMDYTYDECYYMFTADQSAVINWHANNIDFKSNTTVCGGSYGEVVCLEPAAPGTCDDGILNQDEQAVDCGGLTCNPCPSDCGTVFFDPAGPCEVYEDNFSATWTFCPDNATDLITVTFTSFAVEENNNGGCWDFVEVFEGENTSAPQIGGEFCGDGTGAAPGGGAVSTTTPGSCLTFSFETDGSVTEPGWEANITCFNALPVELVQFKGALKDNVVQLDWGTASETQNKGFEIQRSANGANFENIGFVAGQINSTIQNDYVFYDRHIVKGQQYYYRLKQLDQDGGFTFSDVVAIEIPDGRGVISIYPNPSKEETIVLDTDGKDFTTMTYTIFDLQGRVLMEGVVDEDRKIIPIQNLQKGIYIIKVLENNLLIDSQKLIRL